jgi:hypothetical protein
LDQSLNNPKKELDVHMGGKDMVCIDCHTNTPEGRMNGIEGVYIPGQSHSSDLDIAGLGLVVLTAFGVFIHTLIGFFSKKKKVTEEE